MSFYPQILVGGLPEKGVRFGSKESPMDLEILQKMGATELRSYLEFLLHHYRVMDSFWYIYITENFDEATADRINEKVWSSIPAMAVRELKDRFAIREGGLQGFVEVLKYWPWTILVGYEIQQKPDEVIVSVPSCPTQVARLRRGLKEYHCKEMHRGEFVSFAREIDPRIQVECEFAPPDPHPEDMFCRWRLFIDDQEV
jgi:hypothetical protein